MDAKRFNELTKALASGQSRRGVAKGLAAGLLGGVLGFKNRGDADAGRRPSGPGTVCREQANCEEDLRCMYDARKRRDVCTCVNPYCEEQCLNYCYNFNSGFNHTVNQIEDCEEFCATECIDPTCSYRFN